MFFGENKSLPASSCNERFVALVWPSSSRDCIWLVSSLLFGIPALMGQLPKLRRMMGDTARGSSRKNRLCALSASQKSEDFAYPDIGAPAYWDQRYLVEDHHEWIADYSELQHIIKSACPTAAPRILNLGCGSSRLSEDLYDDGYKDIVNIDISFVVIEKMRARNLSERPQMEWLVRDATHLADFESNSFDLVLDKGTFDAVAAMKRQLDVVKLLAEVGRILKVGSTYVLVTLNSVLKRNPDVLKMPHFAFDIESHPLKDGCTAICCRKLPDADPARHACLDALLERAAACDEVSAAAAASSKAAAASAMGIEFVD